MAKIEALRRQGMTWADAAQSQSGVGGGCVKAENRRKGGRENIRITTQAGASGIHAQTGRKKITLGTEFQLEGVSVLFARQSAVRHKHERTNRAVDIATQLRLAKRQ